MRQLIIKFALFLLRKATKSNLVDYAKKEFIRANWCDKNEVFEDPMQKAICQNVIDMLCVFSNEGHSGFSATYALKVFDKVVCFNPLSPLTGADNEWQEVGDDTYQNVICSAIFKKGKKGKAYWLDHYVFRNQHGNCFTSYRSRQFIEFPWVPTDSVYVDVIEDKQGNVIYPDHIKPIEY